MSSPPPPPGWNPPSGGPSWPPGPPGQPPPGGMPPGPGGYGPPGGTPPPFGLPGQPPPPRRSNAGVLIAAIVGGGLVLILIAAAVFFVVLKDDKKSPTEQLSAAATSLSSARALGLRGTFGSASDSLDGDLKVTASGRVTGPVTWSGDRLTLLSSDGNLFVKADRSYWSKQLSTTDVPNFIKSGERWGKLESNKLTFDFKQYVTPSALAAKMRQVSKLSVKSETKATVQGRAATKITTLSAAYYLSDEKDPRLLRVESTFPAFNADVTPQAGGDASGTVSEFRNRIGELKDAVDATRRPRIQQVDGCKNKSTSGCTVRVRVWTSGASGSTTQVSIYVWITATTKTGRKLGDCTTSATTTGLDSTWAECRVSSSEWASFFGNTRVDRRWWMQADAVAIGASPTDIQTMQSGLDRE